MTSTMSHTEDLIYMDILEPFVTTEEKGWASTEAAAEAFELYVSEYLYGRCANDIIRDYAERFLEGANYHNIAVMVKANYPELFPKEA